MDRCRACRRPINNGEPHTFRLGWWYCEDHSLWPIADDDPINQPPSRIYEPEPTGTEIAHAMQDALREVREASERWPDRKPT